MTLFYTCYVELKIASLERKLGKKASFGWSLGDASELEEVVPDFEEKIFTNSADVELSFPRSKVRKLRQRGKFCYERLKDEKLADH